MSPRIWMQKLDSAPIAGGQASRWERCIPILCYWCRTWACIAVPNWNRPSNSTYSSNIGLSPRLSCRVKKSQNWRPRCMNWEHQPDLLLLFILQFFHEFPKDWLSRIFRLQNRCRKLTTLYSKNVKTAHDSKSSFRWTCAKCKEYAQIGAFYLLSHNSRSRCSNNPSNKCFLLKKWQNCIKPLTCDIVGLAS